MYLLHLGCQSDRRFYLWAEDSEAPREGTDDHPFAADVWTLWDIFDEIAPGWMLERTGDRVATLLLPSSERGPQAAPELLGDASTDAERTVDRLRPWKVPVLTIEGGAAAEWLRADRPRERGLRVDGTWICWSRLADIADTLVRAGQLLPDIEQREGRHIGLWRPLPARQPILEQLRHIEEALPPLVRAELSPRLAEKADKEGWDSARPPSIHAIVARALTGMVDGLARRRLQADDRQLTIGDEINTATVAWLNALIDDDPIVRGLEDETETLAKNLGDWTRQLRRAQQRRVRLCFRLEPPILPDEEADGFVPVDESWQLDFLLQSIAEPSLKVEAETIWASAEEAREVLDRHLDRPRERLLEELGRASRLYPTLREALEQAEPTGLQLDNERAFRFLEEVAPLLDQSGFGVDIPAWWGGADHRLGARLAVDSSEGSSGSGLGLDTLCRFNWEVALGDETLTGEELEQLARLKRPLIQRRGEWVALDPDDVEAALEMLETSGDMQAGEAVQTALGMNDTELPVVDHRFDGWLGELFEAGGDDRVASHPTPQTFDGELRPYQSRGLGWIAYLERLGLGGCLADDMGLGKTIQVLARMAEEREADRPDPGPTLAVVPLSVVGNWKHEAERFVPDLDVLIHHGPDRAEGDGLADLLCDFDLVITTYGVVRSDIDQLEPIRWHRVVLDEAQKVKNSSAGRTRAARRLQADRRLALTGTPVENRLTELWSIMQFLNPGMLGAEKQFRDEIAHPVEAGHHAKTEVLRRLTGPFILRRLKTDERIIDDLPDKTEIKEYCSLTAEQVTLYQAAVDDIMEKIAGSEGIDRRGAILKLMTQLKQICNHPAQFLDEPEDRLEGRSGKLERLEELVAEIDDVDEKVLIFTQYTAMGERIRHHLQNRLGREVLYLHGQTTQPDRDRMVQRFQSDDGPPIFLLSLRAGGTGLTLTAASHVIHYDRWWNPAVEDQATDRAFRIGQTKDVQVRKLICEGTFEERIDEMIERKKALADRVLSEGEAFLTELSTDELRDIVALSREELT